MKTLDFKTLDHFDPQGKRILLRVDLNVPIKEGIVQDDMRLKAVAPTIKELADRGGRVILIGHLGSPKGKVVPQLSLRPVAEKLAQILGREISFATDCIGADAKDAAFALKDGDILMLENTRFHPQEEMNDPEFTKELSSLGDVYVNDAFSVAHREHASTTGLSSYLPPFGGRLMQDELGALREAMRHPQRPLGAIIGGAKVSTKLRLLESLVEKVDALFIGGAMSMTFLAAQEISVGKSQWEPSMLDTAKNILSYAKKKNCHIHLPQDVTISEEFMAGAPAMEVDVKHIPQGWMALDIGPKTANAWRASLGELKTLLWNGPLGVVELPPFDTGTVLVAHEAARLTQEGKLKTIAGGGDTAAALRHAGVLHQFTHVSTAGGAFLAWLEGKILPSLSALSRAIEKTFSI